MASSKVKDRLKFLIQELGDDDDHDLNSPKSAVDGDENNDDDHSEASCSLTDLSDITVSDNAEVPLRHSLRGRLPGRPAGDAASQLHILEERVLQLAREKTRIQAQYDQDVRAKNTEILQLSENLRRIEERQQQVEAKAPLFAQQTQQAKIALKDLRISEVAYQELANTPSDKLSLPDYAKMVVHEAVRDLKAENERLKVAVEGGREAGARLESDKARLQRENARLAAELAEKDRDLDDTVGGLQTRIDRLAKELEGALTHVEVLTAKGQMYDDLQDRAERLEEDNRRLLAAEAGAKRVEKHADELEGLLKERDHTLQMLMMDKAYLSRQVESLQEQVQKLERECERRSSKVTELKKARQELWDKLVSESGAAKEAQAASLHQEVAKIQAAAQADLERIRRESMEAYDREARLLRDLRDEAQAEAAQLQASLKRLQQEHTTLAEKYADTVRLLEGRVAELQVKATASEFEAERQKQLAAEREVALGKANTQIEMLQEKVKVLTESFYELEADKNRSVAQLNAQVEQQAAALAQYRALEGNLDQAITAAAAGGLEGEAGDEQLAKVLDAAGLAAVRIRLRHSVALAARCSRLEVERTTLAKELEEARGKVAKVEAELAVAQHRAKAAGQPHAFLLDELQAAKEKAGKEVERAKALEGVLRQQGQEMQAMNDEMVAMRGDLHLLLQQRAQLEALKAVVSSALEPVVGRRSTPGGHGQESGGRRSTPGGLGAVAVRS